MKTWLTALIFLALTACSGATRINHFGYDKYSGSTAYIAADNGEMALVVLGSPVDTSPQALSQAISDAMRGSHVDHRTVFVPTNQPDMSGYRTVVIFGSVKPEDICSVRNADGLAKDSPTPMAAAFCYGEEGLSYVSGSVPKISSADDRSLAAHMNLVGETLFPNENPHYQSDCGSHAPICGD